MAIIAPNVLSYWNYFLAIESDLEHLTRYLEFHPDNFKCFSIEIARILLASSAEVEVVCKQICLEINPSSKADNIKGYQQEIIRKHPKISEVVAFVPRYGLELRPFCAWKTGNIPNWWTAYTNIKHHRDSDYNQANLKNAIDSVAGLFFINLFFYHEKVRLISLRPHPKPKILDVSLDTCGGLLIEEYEPKFIMVASSI